MMQETDATLLRIEPEVPAQACVIWLHGLGANGYDFQPIVPYLELPEDLPVRFLFPHAPSMPVTVNGGMVMPAWYDILEMNVGRKVDKTSLIASGERIAALINSQIAAGISASKIVLAGFSQGGAVAYHTALCFPQRLAGLIALSTYMATAEEIEQGRSADNADLPIWIGHGNMDDVVPLQLGQEALSNLQRMNYQAAWQDYPMGHEVALEEIQEIGRWITQRLTEG